MAKKQKEYISGKVICLRSDSDYCVCCKGKHIHHIHIEIQPYDSEVFAGVKVKSVDDFIQEFLTKNKEILDGKRIRIMIEEL